jgi:hypothetical protein
MALGPLAADTTISIPWSAWQYGLTHQHVRTGKPKKDKDDEQARTSTSVSGLSTSPLRTSTPCCCHPFTISAFLAFYTATGKPKRRNFQKTQTASLDCRSN